MEERERKKTTNDNYEPIKKILFLFFAFDEKDKNLHQAQQVIVENFDLM